MPGKKSKKSAKGSKAFSFDSGALAKRLLSAAPERSRDVIARRFGLGTSSERETLESIGGGLGITRERVRQIEAAGLLAIQVSKVFRDSKSSFDEITRHIEFLGAIVHEDNLLKSFGKDEKIQNRFRFFLIVGSGFIRERETEDFLARWHIDRDTAKKVHDALTKLYTSLKDDQVLQEGELLSKFIDELKGVNSAYLNDEILKRWLNLSKKIGSNPLSEWGKKNASSINVKGIRDYAYLAIKRHGKPMHFSEVASAISTVFSKKAHIATTHNELIKDPRFVLVGRGLYALTEWGYKPGVVRDVIRGIISTEGPMKKDDIIKHVKKARFVKDNTILVNLNDPKYFKRQKDGHYTVV